MTSQTQINAPRTQFLDPNGVPLNGGSVATYVPGTFTPVTTFADPASSTQNSNPATLDSLGSVSIWADGLVRMIVKDQFGNQIYDQVGGGVGTIGPPALAWNTLYGGPPAVEYTGSTGTAMTASIADNSNVRVATNFINNNSAVTLPFGKAMLFEAGASLTSSGSGSFTPDGTVTRTNYNPGNMTAWNVPLMSTDNYEGFSVVVGNYGGRSFGGTNTPTAVTGAVNVPSGATAGFHAQGIAGYVKNTSSTMGAVGSYAQADCLATNALVWSFNSRTIDNGFQTTAWGAELDFNISNSATNVLGIDMVGGSAVEPGLAIAFHVQAIGIVGYGGTPPAKRWTYALRTTDGSTQVGIELGATLETQSGVQPIQAYYINASSARALAYRIGGDNTGNIFMRTETDDTLFDIQARHAGANTPNIRLYASNTGINNTGIPAFPLDIVGAIKFSPGASVTPPSNGDIVFEFTNATTFTVRGKSGGVVKSGTITLS